MGCVEWVVLMDKERNGRNKIIVWAGDALGDPLDMPVCLNSSSSPNAYGFPSIGIVFIGRNEGDRPQRCLVSLVNRVLKRLVSQRSSAWSTVGPSVCPLSL